MRKHIKQTEKDLYKTEKFNLFIETIKKNEVGHWIQIARAIGICNDTIHRWKKLPRARKAIKEAIDSTMEKMEKAGKNDWKMWESKLKMLGVAPVDKSEMDITSGGKVIPILNGITKKSDVHKNNSDREASKAPQKD